MTIVYCRLPKGGIVEQNPGYRWPEAEKLTKNMGVRRPMQSVNP